MESRTFVYKRTPQCEMKLDVHYPSSPRPLPVVVYIHGGALICGSRKDVANEHLDLYLGAGFAVIAIDYRLAPETKLPEILADVTDAFAWIRSHAGELQIDPDRMGVVGHSAGGYLTLCAGCMVQPRPRAIISFYGYGDIAAAWYARPDPFYCTQPMVTADEAAKTVGTAELTEGRGDRWRFYLYCRQQGLWIQHVTGLDPRVQREAILKFCPQYNVPRDYPPTLLLHGDADTDVPHQQSVDMAAAMAQMSLEHEFVSIPGGGHGFNADQTKPEAQAAMQSVIGFLGKHLRREE